MMRTSHVRMATMRSYLVMCIQATLLSWGWRWELPAAGACCQVTSVPRIFGHPLAVSALPDFVNTAAAGSTAARQAQVPDAVHTLLQSVACRGAIMFGRTLCIREMVDLIGLLATTMLPFHCAHGRPTAACVVDLRQMRSMVATQQRARATQTAATRTRADGRSSAQLRAIVTQALEKART